MVFSSMRGRMSSGVDTYRPSSTGTYRSSTSKYRQNCRGAHSQASLASEREAGPLGKHAAGSKARACPGLAALLRMH